MHTCRFGHPVDGLPGGIAVISHDIEWLAGQQCHNLSLNRFQMTTNCFLNKLVALLWIVYFQKEIDGG